MRLVSAVTGEELDELEQSLQGKVSVLMGKSGVGKTSLLNALQPGLGLRVQEVSRIEKGRHTTTHLELFPFDFGGAVGDTPGMREFGLWDIHWDELASLFPEMRPWVGQCKFRLDCQHDEEPGCAIRKAVMARSDQPATVSELPAAGGGTAMRHARDINRDFRCVYCGNFVSAAALFAGVKNRNHCPYCLWSRHLDLFEAGDRLSACKAPMRPIGVTVKIRHKGTRPSGLSWYMF